MAMQTRQVGYVEMIAALVALYAIAIRGDIRVGALAMAMGLVVLGVYLAQQKR
jgi:hypothetical protein